LFCFLNVTDTPAQKIKQKNNLEVFEKLLSDAIKELIYKPDVNRDINFIFNIRDKNSDNDNISFLKNTIKKIFKEENLKISFSNNDSLTADSNTNIIALTIIGFNTRYNGFVKNKFLGEKTVKREINIVFDYHIKKMVFSENSTATLKNFSNDEVAYEDIEMLESSPYKFTKSTIPQLSTFENIIFPLTLVIVSAITVIMFFVIRTK
jgi:hypothetical protein